MGRVLPFCRNAVSVFCSPSWMGHSTSLNVILLNIIFFALFSVELPICSITTRYSIILYPAPTFLPYILYKLYKSLNANICKQSFSFFLFFFLLSYPVDWVCRTRRLHICWGVRPHLMKLYSWSFGKCERHLDCHYFQVRSDSQGDSMSPIYVSNRTIQSFTILETIQLCANKWLILNWIISIR